MSGSALSGPRASPPPTPLRILLNPSPPPILEGPAAPTMTGLLSCFFGEATDTSCLFFNGLPHIRSLSLIRELASVGFVLSRPGLRQPKTRQRQDDKDSAFDWMNPKSAIMKNVAAAESGDLIRAGYVQHAFEAGAELFCPLCLCSHEIVFLILCL